MQNGCHALPPKRKGLEAMKPILVMGHRNPDNDSIASAVAYAYLKNKTDPDETYVPVRLGPMPDETAWVFERYGIETPQVIRHVSMRVGDAMSSPVISVPITSTMLDAGRLMSARNLRALVVTGDDGSYAGLITDRRLAELYIEDIGVVESYRAHGRVADYVSTLDGTLAAGDPEMVLDGHLFVAASEHEAFLSVVAPGDTIVMGDRVNTQRLALQAGARCLVLTCGALPSPALLDLAHEKGACIVLSERDTFTATRLLTLAQTLEDYLDTDVATFSADTLLREASEAILDSPLREGVVLEQRDGVDYCVGIITRSDIARSRRRRVILVDHNETAQAAPGISDAEVVEIVDHHRVGDIQTSMPIRFIDLPLGSTATIVAQRYLAEDVDIPQPMAAALLSAIMTDTVLLKSPTATPTDERMSMHLARLLQTEPVTFGRELFKRRGDESSIPIESLVGADAKEFETGDATLLIAQHETVNLPDVLAREDEIYARLDALVAERGYALALLLVTDVVDGGSQFIVSGDRHAVERAFSIDLSQGSVWMDGILSRKKQVAPRLLEQGV